MVILFLNRASKYDYYFSTRMLVGQARQALAYFIKRHTRPR